MHDNQCLGYGLLAIERDGLPVLGTIHHPITVDRRLEIEHAEGWYKRLTLRRWYSFTNMQTRVAKRMQRVVTVSENSFRDIARDHQVDPNRMAIVPVGVDLDLFRPLPARRPRARPAHHHGQRGRDDEGPQLPARGPGQAPHRARRRPPGRHRQAQARRQVRRDDPQPRARGRRQFVTGVPDERIIELYSEAELAVVPSLYEGFSLPAIEAMSCGTPLVATTGGALPEVVGRDGETALVVPPGDSEALAAKLRWALGRDDLRATIGTAGRQRVVDQWSWKHTAAKTVEQYRILLAEHERVRNGGTP